MQREIEIFPTKPEPTDWVTNGIVHDFNNMLTTILTQASTALAKLPQDSPAREDVEKTIRSTERAAALTQQFLAFVNTGKVQFDLIDLNQIICEELDILRNRLPTQIRVVTNLTQEPLLMRGNQSQIQQVLMNLLLNAAEAIEETPGQITLSTEICVLSPRETERFLGQNPLLPGEYILLEVRDTGSGIERQLLNRIFEPHFTTKLLGQGIGLATTRAIVHTHRGGIYVQSTSGLGSTFQIIFPTAAGPTGTGQRCSTRYCSQRGRSKVTGNTLIIDDEPAIRESLAELLELSELPAMAAADGREGVAIYQKHRHQIGVVLLDVEMSSFNGIQTLNALRQIDPSVPVILTSGHSQNEIDYPMADDMNLAFIRKPYNIECLLDLVRSFVNARP